MADGIRATPRQNQILGLLADRLKQAQQFGAKPFGYENPPVEMLMNLLGVPAVQQTLERISYGEPLTTGKGMTTQVRPEAMEAAMTLLPMASGIAKATKNMPVGMMFIGPESQSWNKTMAFEASKMAKKGATPQEIWKATGTVKGPDGQWRQEISDKLSKYDPEALADLKARDDFDYLKHTQPLGGTLEHKELYKAYPDIGDVPVHFMPAERMKGAYGAYSPTHDRLTLSDQLTPAKARSSSLHEIQHAIQEREGFAVGGNQRDFAKIAYEANQKIGDLNNKMRDIVKQMDNPNIAKQDKELLSIEYEDLMNQRMSLVKDAQIDPMQAYGNLMGEAEARLTQRRMDLGPRQRRENFPFEYTGETGYGLDVPLEGLIHMTPEGTIIRRGLLGQ